MQSGHFPSGSARFSKKVCYKVSLCEYCQQQSCKAFTGLTVQKWLMDDVPFYMEILPKLTYPVAKLVSISYLLIALQL